MPTTIVGKVIVCSLTMVLVGAVGSFLSMGAPGDWYENLKRPAGTPPNWVFGPVWTVLYALIGASFALIWHHFPGEIGRSRATVFFVLQLLLNLAWTPVFFGAHEMTFALVVIIVLWLAIALTIRAFSRLSKPAAWLLTPYLLWVTYATYLNAGFALLN